MPPAQDDARARQLEAMRQYFAELGVQRNDPTVEASEPQPASERRRRPSRPWLLLTGLLVVVALVGEGLVGAVAWPDDRPAGSSTADVSSATQRPATMTPAGPVASAACKTAVDRANAMLASAVRLREAVGEQGRILRDPASRRLSGPSCWSGSLRRCGSGPASRTGSTAAWPTTGRSSTSASCKPLEPGRAGQRCMVAKTITFDHRPIGTSPVMLLMALLSPL
jgi:hypothetical protein